MTTLNIYLTELSAESSIVLYQHGRFEGRHITFTNDEPNLLQHGFNDWVSSLEVKGRTTQTFVLLYRNDVIMLLLLFRNLFFLILGDYVWEVFEHTNYGGRSTAAPPGVYGYNWVKDHIGNDVISSVRSG